MREATVEIGALQLDCGERIERVEQRLTLYGSPAPDGSNVVLIEHALTGSSRAAEWWPGIVGDGGLFAPPQWCAIGINALGSCYGSTRTSATLSVRDIVNAERRALRAIGVERAAVVTGGSLGGMRALQWALDAPERVGHAIVVGAHDHHSPMGIALNALQREALAIDPVRGLRLARKLAMLTYKSEALLNERHGRRRDRGGKPRFDVEGYLELQADLFEARMDAVSYAALTHAMDSFDVRDARARDGASLPALTFVGIGSDWLFRPQDVWAAAERFARRGWNARYLELRSDHGHDAFLAEPGALRALLTPHVTPPPAAAVRS